MSEEEVKPIELTDEELENLEPVFADVQDDVEDNEGGEE